MSGINYATFEKDFRTTKRLGKGNYATVTEVQHLLDQRTYAHKCIELPTLDDLTQAITQIQTNKCLDDDRTVKIHFYYIRENKKTGKYELALIMDLCHATLAESIRARRRRNDYFNKAELKDFLATMIPFFAKMQRKEYLHRDIKPDNILLHRNMFNKIQFKVGDFGFSIRLNSYSTQNIAGTMQYVSPKLLVKFKDNKVIVPGHNYKDDVYSLGKTIYELMVLEVNSPFDQLRLMQCASRYGPEYCGLVSLMLKETEIERPDFIYLERYATKMDLINEGASEITKNNFLSISTVNGSKSKEKVSLSKGEQSKSKSKQRTYDYTKTRRKDPMDTNVEITKIQEKVTKIQQNTNTHLKKPMIKQEIIRKKVIKYNQEIRSLAICNSCLFLGSRGKLGIMLLANEKIIKLRCEIFKGEVTCIKIDPLKRFVYFSTVDYKLITIQFTEIKRLIIQNNETLKNKSEIQLLLSKIKYKVFELEHEIYTFDCFYHDDSKDPTFLIGHCNGKVTYLTGEIKKEESFFYKQTITQIAFHSGCVYMTNTQGVFLRQIKPAIGECNQKEQIKDIRLQVQEKNSVYKYHALFVGFQILDNCKLNEDIPKESSKYLAILVSYDGVIHFINRSFRLARLLDITYSPVLAASFEANPITQLGVNGVIVDTQGKIFGEEGQVLAESQEKQGVCVAGSPNQLYVGSFNGGITILSRKQALRID